MVAQNKGLWIIAAIAICLILGMMTILRQAFQPPELQALSLQQDIAKLNYKTAKINAASTLEQTGVMRYVNAGMAIFYKVLPLMVVVSVIVGLICSPVKFEFGAIKTYLSRRDVKDAVRGALLVSAMSEQTKAEVFKQEILSAHVSNMAKLSSAFKAAPQTQAAIPETAASQEDHKQSTAIPLFSAAVNDFKAGSVLLGYDDNASPVYLSVKDFVSCAFGGGSGSGKTSKLRFLVAQLILDGANVSILDAHQGNGQSLVDSLGVLASRPNVRVYHPFDTREAVNAMLSEVQTAIDANINAETPYIYVLDELRPLNRACEHVETLMDKIANEGRKYDRFLVASSQTWEAKMFGKSGSAARDACVLKMAARMPKEQARTLFKDGESARVVAKLDKGEMYADSMTFSGVVTVPFASREDIDALAEKTAIAAKTVETMISPFQRTFDALKATKTLRDIWQESGLSANMTLSTFETKARPSADRYFDEHEQAAIMQIAA